MRPEPKAEGCRAKVDGQSPQPRVPQAMCQSSPVFPFIHHKQSGYLMAGEICMCIGYVYMEGWSYGANLFMVKGYENVLVKCRKIEVEKGGRKEEIRSRNFGLLML